MKISYKWLKSFVDTTLSPEEISLALTGIGLEVESLEKVQAIAGGLEGLVVGEVLTCAQHPNADRLRVTTVNVGEAAALQIVCGAPNVAAGQKVIVATVGTTVYPLEGEPFKISKSKIRSEVSEGMICAEDEIGLGKSHDGIMVLPADTVPGTPAKRYFNLEDDFVFEIGLTPNRADAASHLGVARDLAAFLRTGHKFPDLGRFEPGTGTAIPVELEDPAACPRYSSLLISGVIVRDSPDWLKDQLKVIGIRPINNIVDVTNYVLHGLGQPLHAFDAARIKGNKVIVRKAAKGEKFITLDGVERSMSAEDLMICNESEPMCIAGVFGGLDSGISETTTEVFLESAYFNPVSVRKTAKRHTLKTDASFRFERGTDPEMTVPALKYAALLITELAGGKVSSLVDDQYPQPVPPFEFAVRYDHINRLIGAEIPAQEIRAIIEALGIQVLAEVNGQLHLRVPAYKVDVTREVDITEEVLRIYGYDNIAIPQKVNASLAYSAKPDPENTQQLIADLLAANGFTEILCNSLTKGAYSRNFEEAVQILNPLSSDLNVLRQELLFPALESVAYNQNRKNADLKFFEFGKTYRLVEEKYVESSRLLVLLSGNARTEQWNRKAQTANFYQLKAVVDGVMGRLGLSGFQTAEAPGDTFAYGLKYFRGEKVLVSFGEALPADRKATGVEKAVFYADFDWQALIDSTRKNKIFNKDIPKFPSVRRDLSLLIDQSVVFDDLKSVVYKTERKLVRDIQVFDVYQGEKLPAGKKSYAISLTLQDDEQTLTDQKIDALMQKIIGNLEKQSGAEIRK
ncbi:phenylalanine--tRNA ligase subunit beta [Pedobacter yulinensis]|uniref:Phenylalanine--tRNA ligase beta subunit n=1 Tax=Pedobacter yulinensis TaxID=2126353 RepID=A0A2T3HIR2_9SPHI|nr:phenylalanine--tRNA ligase subunit beta [Pedobacter yulinensis]PST82322.1 phenylalanine--tRNA ligase subunit beta [Pedobacter yulinensis]